MELRILISRSSELLAMQRRSIAGAILIAATTAVDQSAATAGASVVSAATAQSSALALASASAMELRSSISQR